MKKNTKWLKIISFGSAATILGVSPVVLTSCGNQSKDDPSFLSNWQYDQENNILKPSNASELGLDGFYLTLTASNSISGYHGIDPSVTSIKLDLSKITGYQLTKIDTNAFRSCTALTAIKLPSSVNAIGISAFYQCSNLTSVSLSDQLVNIDDGAFSFCTALETINLPESLLHIGDNVFFGCTNLKNTNIPSKVTFIGNNVYENCNEALKVVVSLTSPSTCQIGSPATNDQGLGTPRQIFIFESEAIKNDFVNDSNNGWSNYSQWM